MPDCILDLLRLWVSRACDCLSIGIPHMPGNDTEARIGRCFSKGYSEGDANLLPPWQKSARKAKSAVSAFLHFQRLTDVENGDTSLCRGKLQ